MNLSNFAINVTDEVLTADKITALENSFRAALNLRNYRIPNITAYNVTTLATQLRGWVGCDCCSVSPGYLFRLAIITEIDELHIQG
jgi:hypothetical protein